MEPLLDLPHYQVLVDKLPESDLDACERFWSALWHHYIRNKGSTSLPYWSEQFSSPLLFNGVLILWKDYLQCEVIPERSWAEVKLNEKALLNHFSEAALINYRKNHKITQYLPEAKPSTAAKIVRSKRQFKKTGLVRKGFQSAGNSQYFYDHRTLSKHKQLVINNTTKSMRKLRSMMDIPMDDASYDSISTDIVEYLSTTPFIMTPGNSYCDSRGRAIKESLSKVANPIGFKDFRALITIPKD